MIKAIFLDIGGVLILSRYREVVESWADKMRVPSDQLRQTLKKFSHYGMKGDTTSHENFLKENKISWITAEQLETLQKDAWNSEYLNKELLDFILENKDKYTFGIITNNYREAEQLIMKKFNVPKFYKVFVSSADIGILKPDKRIYHYALEQANVSAEQSILIDDQEENIKGASEMGMFGIRYKDNTSLFKRIAEISNQ